MRKAFSLILVLTMAVLLSSCVASEFAIKRTAQGGAIGAGLGYVFGGGAGAKLGAVAGATAGAIFGSVEDEVRPSVVSTGGATSPRRSIFQPREYNRGEKDAHERGRADRERQRQYQRENRAYDRGRRGY